MPWPRERGPQLMSALQDSCQREVGDRFGLGRGERGSKRKHQEIDRKAGFLDRALAGGFGKSQLQQTVELARDHIRDLEKRLAKLRTDNLSLEQKYQRVEDQVMKIVTMTREERARGIRERVGKVLDEIVRRAEKVAGRRFTGAEDSHVRDAVRASRRAREAAISASVAGLQSGRHGEGRYGWGQAHDPGSHSYNSPPRGSRSSGSGSAPCRWNAGGE